MKKKIIKILIIILIISAIGFVGYNFVQQRNEANIVTVKTKLLTKENLFEKMSLKGMVESHDTKKIYSNLNFQIEKINVKVGDKVSKGDVLVELDTKDLELSIEERKAELSLSEQSSLLELSNNERLYNQAVANINSSNNSQINNMVSNLDTAKNNFEIAENNYLDAKSDFESAKGTTILEENLKTAELDYKTKKEDFESNKILYENGIISRELMDQKENLYVNAENKIEEIRKNIEINKDNEKRNMERLEKELKMAQDALSNAETNLQTTKVSSEQELENYRKNIESSKLSNNLNSRVIGINRLENQLQEAQILSPISGTITAVYKEVGENASGLLFVIEDQNRLVINTRIREYDLNKLKLNDKVEITSDSIFGKNYSGEIIEIEPAAVKDTKGDTDTSAGSEFKALIKIVDADENIKIGMNTNLSIVTNMKENILSIPYDSIKKGEDGEYYIFQPEILNNDYIAKSLKVEKGSSFNFNVEIFGDEINEGIEYITDVSKIKDGEKIKISQEVE